ncbi:MAG: TrbG/VirB9 family P-type conjugative transfer protein [Candidatus Accumulibacter sp.]|jgi:pilus assembly protein CpaC|nr:TrbG/VirB9 family P-type conjugative transfer protein [Accumulibacter sp.]
MVIQKGDADRAIPEYKKLARCVAASLALAVALPAAADAPPEETSGVALPASAAAPLPQPQNPASAPRPTPSVPTPPAAPLLYAPAWSPPPRDLEAFHLYVGEARVIKLPRPVLKTAVGNGKVLSVAALNANELLMIASDAGRSTLHLWLDDGSEISYAAEVAADSPAKMYAQVRETFGEDVGIRVNLVGNRVFLRAETLTPGQMNLVKALQQAFGDDKIVLITEGDVALEERTVHVNAQLVEIKSSALEELGVKWSETIHGPSLSVVGDMKLLGTDSKDVDGKRYYYLRPKEGGEGDGVPGLDEWPGYTQPFRTAFSLATLITSKINLLRSQGDAYIVAEPRLTARCGGKADFTSGGEMPIPLQSGLGATTVEFKKYGVRLAIEPQCDRLGNIRAKVSTEVSQIDDAVAVLGVPGLLTRQVESELDLVDGKSMLLSGLASHETGKNESRVPFFGRIPLLGHLFKSTGTNGGRSELIVIITPRFVTPESDTIKKSVQRGGQLSGETEESLLDQGLAPLDEKEKKAKEAKEATEAKEAAAAAERAASDPAPPPEASPPRHIDYLVTGEVSWRPLRVHSDGRQTVIEMPPGLPVENAPVLLVVQRDAAAAPPVRYRREDSRYVVDAVLERAVLVAGAGFYRESVTIARQP